jgi:membrane-associated phospholipid phosphatase
MWQIDHDCFGWINTGIANPYMDMICPVLRDKYTWIPVYLIAAVYLLYRYRSSAAYLIVFAGLAVGASDALSNLVKHLVHRLRPCAVESAVRLLVSGCSQSYSFTSSHAANHFALAVFMILALRLGLVWSMVLLFWAGSIAFSQVYVGLHYPSDVLAGAALGAGVAWVMYWIYTRAASGGVGTAM